MALDLLHRLSDVPLPNDVIYLFFNAHHIISHIEVSISFNVVLKVILLFELKHNDFDGEIGRSATDGGLFDDK